MKNVFGALQRHLAIILALAMGVLVCRPVAADTVHTSVPESVATRALQYIGVPYRFGGNTPQSGFDCSGLVNHVYRETLGVILPRTSRQLAKIGVSVGLEDLRPGDLVFFNTRGAPNSHVGIYLGDSRFIHAPRARTLVRIDRLDDPGYRERFEGARRLDPFALVIAPVDPRG